MIYNNDTFLDLSTVLLLILGYAMLNYFHIWGIVFPHKFIEMGYMNEHTFFIRENVFCIGRIFPWGIVFEVDTWQVSLLQCQYLILIFDVVLICLEKYTVELKFTYLINRYLDNIISERKCFSSAVVSFAPFISYRYIDVIIAL